MSGTPSFDDMTIDQKILVMSIALNEVQTTQKKHHALLVEGNGARPLVQRVLDLEEFTGTIKFWFRTIAVALVLQTITFGAAAIVYFVRLYPLLSQIAEGK